MPDILKVTTPLVNRNEIVLPKPGMDAVSPFNISDPLKVVQTHNQSEILKHNTTNQQNSDTPVVLLNMLKDPAVAVSYLKNIFLLEEMFKLLPANNKAMTPELEQIFKDLLINENQIKNELMSQEKSFTMFRGDFFDFLRTLSDTYKNSQTTQLHIANLLKSINNLMSREEILDSVVNSMMYLKQNLTSSPSISAKLDELIAKFKNSNETSFNIAGLKEEVLSLIKQIEGSILFSSKMSKVVSIMMYNLSRFNDNYNFFNESVYRLRQTITPAEQKELMELVAKFSNQLNSGTLPISTTDAQNSRVMDALIKMVFNQSQKQNAADSAKVDMIIHSLLSSPCNFTPLLHFVLPVLFDNTRAFAEIWINPQSDEKDMPDGVSEGKHFLLVIDIETMGRFEAEIFVYNKTVDFNLYCPTGYGPKFESMITELSKDLVGIDYKLGRTKLDTLERPRSLMEVFKSLPYKRMGVDVRI